MSQCMCQNSEAPGLGESGYFASLLLPFCKQHACLDLLVCVALAWRNCCGIHTLA
jgi:hypothetical protein